MYSQSFVSIGSDFDGHQDVFNWMIGVCVCVCVAVCMYTGVACVCVCACVCVLELQYIYKLIYFMKCLNIYLVYDSQYDAITDNIVINIHKPFSQLIIILTTLI